MENNFFHEVRNKKIRRTDWSEDEYFIPYRITCHKDPYDVNERYYLLGQYYLNEIEFIICEQEIANGFKPDKYGTAWEVYGGNKNHDFSEVH